MLNHSSDNPIEKPDEDSASLDVSLPRRAFLAIAAELLILGPPSTATAQSNASELENGTLTFRGASAVSLEFEINDSQLSDPKVVDHVVNPERTVTFQYQTGSVGTVLRITNPFSQDLDYDCDVVHKPGNTPKTMNCWPVYAGKMAYEHWPEVVVSVALSNFRLSEPRQGDGS